MSYPTCDLKIMQLKAYLAWSCHLGMHNSEIYNMMSRDMIRIAGSAATPRHFKVILKAVKNDPLGTGPVEGMM
jgi:hypothetical protein